MISSCRIHLVLQILDWCSEGFSVEFVSYILCQWLSRIRDHFPDYLTRQWSSRRPYITQLTRIDGAERHQDGNQILFHRLGTGSFLGSF